MVPNQLVVQAEPAMARQSSTPREWGLLPTPRVGNSFESPLVFSSLCFGQERELRTISFVYKLSSVWLKLREINFILEASEILSHAL